MKFNPTPLSIYLKLKICIALQQFSLLPKCQADYFGLTFFCTWLPWLGRSNWLDSGIFFLNFTSEYHIIDVFNRLSGNAVKVFLSTACWFWLNCPANALCPSYLKESFCPLVLCSFSLHSACPVPGPSGRPLCLALGFSSCPLTLA